jgi:gentisate 1,2-dioxygenase
MKFIKLNRKNAIKYGRVGVAGFNYQLPEIEGGLRLSSRIDRRTCERITVRTRIYYILDGAGEFIINEKSYCSSEDLIVIPQIQNIIIV